MIVFDLEWNSGYFDKITLNEILQIGAVKLDETTGKVEDTFTVCIRPRVHKRYAPPVKLLPELKAFEASDLDFRTAVAMFADWCGEETRFGTWGPDDFPALLQNLQYWSVKFPVPETYCDVQLAFAMSMGAESQVSLQRAVEHCNLPDALDFHNAVHDATYTAMLAGKVDREMLDMAQRTTGGRGKKGGTPPRGAAWAGPFESAEALLGSRSGRLAVCPKCGEKVRVSNWQYVGDGPYYARFSCPEHKGHILKLTAKRDKTGRLWASGEVLEATAENVAQLKALKQADGFHTFQVKADQKSKKRRSYHRHGKRKNAG